MNVENSVIACAIRLPADSADLKLFDNFLRENNLDNVKRFSAKDDDDLNDAVCAGNFSQVIFLTLDDLLDAIWTGHIQIDRWTAAGVRIDVAIPPFPGAVDWPQWVSKTADGYLRHRSRTRRRQIIAAVILSLFAIASIAVLFAMLPANH